MYIEGSVRSPILWCFPLLSLPVLLLGWGRAVPGSDFALWLCVDGRTAKQAAPEAFDFIREADVLAHILLVKYYSLLFGVFSCYTFLFCPPWALLTSPSEPGLLPSPGVAPGVPGVRSAMSRNSVMVLDGSLKFHENPVCSSHKPEPNRVRLSK